MAKYSEIVVEVPSEFNERFVSESGLYDVQSPDFYIQNVEARDSDEAIEKVAVLRNASLDSLEVYEASNPG